MVDAVGIEPTTCRLRARNLLFSALLTDCFILLSFNRFARIFLCSKKLWVLPTIAHFFEAVYPQKSPQSFLPDFFVPQELFSPLIIRFLDTAAFLRSNHVNL